MSGSGGGKGIEGTERQDRVGRGRWDKALTCGKRGWGWGSPQAPDRGERGREGSSVWPAMGPAHGCFPKC